jgi:hypothetical protein
VGGETLIVPFYAGTAYAWLGGQPRRVEEYAERTLALCDAAPAAWPVTRALARLDLATARIAQGAPDAAARLGWEILDIYENERQVALILRRAGELREALSTHTSAPDVRLFWRGYEALLSERSPGSLLLKRGLNSSFDRVPPLGC